MSLKKKYAKSKPLCKVTFTVPKTIAGSAKSIQLVGEFNDWSIHQTPLKKMKSGQFSATIDLAIGREYQFRYLIDDCNWVNDSKADRYVRSDYGDCDNSVVAV
jgi:1,4-alpha-glucan branching enzyme